MAEIRPAQIACHRSSSSVKVSAQVDQNQCRFAKYRVKFTAVLQSFHAEVHLKNDRSEYCRASVESPWADLEFPPSKANPPFKARLGISLLSGDFFSDFCRVFLLACDSISIADVRHNRSGVLLAVLRRRDCVLCDKKSACQSTDDRSVVGSRDVACR